MVQMKYKGLWRYIVLVILAGLLCLPICSVHAESLSDDMEDASDRTGWEEIDEDWYYYRADGLRQKGWQSIEGNTYFFDQKGRLRTGWKGRKDKKYYLKERGKPGEIGKAVRGWRILNGKRYHFAADGTMDVGRTAIKGLVYYFKTSGEQRIGWVDEGEGFKRYYYKKSDSKMKWGEPVTSRKYRGYYFLKTGVTSPNAKKCEKRLDALGWDLRNAYNWSKNLTYSGKTVYLESMGSAALAKQGFDHLTGNCYVKAATFYEMARVLGYDAHQIAGAVPSRSGGLANHSWVEMDEEDGTWVYDPVLIRDTVDRFRFPYGKPGTWMYTEYHRMN